MRWGCENNDSSLLFALFHSLVWHSEPTGLHHVRSVMYTQMHMCVHSNTFWMSALICETHTRETRAAELIYCLQASKRNCISKQRADWVHPWRVVGNVNRWHDYRRLTGALQSASWSDRKRAQVSCSWRSAAHTQGIIHHYFYHMPSWAVIGDVGGGHMRPRIHIFVKIVSVGREHL